jgi:predicted nucleic acid-binding protein
LVEVDLLLRGRGHPHAAEAFARACLQGIHQLESCTTDDLSFTLELATRYSDSGIDLPDLSVMAIARRRKGSILTWNHRHFRAAAPRRGHAWSLAVTEDELPDP